MATLPLPSRTGPALRSHQPTTAHWQHAPNGQYYTMAPSYAMNYGQGNEFNTPILPPTPVAMQYQQYQPHAMHYGPPSTGNFNPLAAEYTPRQEAAPTAVPLVVHTQQISAQPTPANVPQ